MSHKAEAETKYDTSTRLELKKLREQVKALPESVREGLRQSYLLNQNIKQLELQNYQCITLVKLQHVLFQKIIDQGLNPHKFKIGGHERGAYERFFRVEPMQYMSKAQFITAMRRVFGDSVLGSEEKMMGKLYDSFDLRHVEEFDWRSFLFLITILMQPILPVHEHLRWGFAIYSSLGALDLECREPLPFRQIRDMMKTPIFLAQRSEFTSIVDLAWAELTLSNIPAAQAAARSKTTDDVLVTYKLFTEMLNTEVMAPLMAPYSHFGIRDPRPWTYVIEETYFNSLYVDLIKVLRREARCEEACIAYLEAKDMRRKQLVLVFWKELLKRRCMVRKMIIVVSNKWKNDRSSIIFVKWREQILVNAAVIMIQKWIRGFNARRRPAFIKRMHKRVIRIQALYRSHAKKKIVQQQIMGRRWAATHVQRIVRGFLARKKTRSRVLAYVDVQRRLLARKKEAWIAARQLKATIAIQMYIRRFIYNCRVRKRELQTGKNLFAAQEQDLVMEQSRIARDVFKLKLKEWFSEKKRLYDLVTIQEHTTLQEKAKIRSYRNKQKEELAKIKAKEREERIARLDEIKIESWIAKWEQKSVDRMQERGRYCRQSLFNPETVEQQDLKKILQEAIKKHIKVVLRRADKQNIPMEIPEAQDIATEEIIEIEIELEKKKVVQERFDEATAIQKVEDDKKAHLEMQEKEYKIRRRDGSASLLQGYYRIFQARKIKTALAQKRFIKHFDSASLTYYYKDKRSGKTQWEKPLALGDHDCPAVDGYLMIFDKDGLNEPYYYCPQTWQMQWEQPVGTILCEICGSEFACATLLKQIYGPNCLYKKAQELLAIDDDPTHILFKEFFGHTKNAANTRFAFIKETNWYIYCVKNDPVLKAMVEEAQRLEEEKKKNAPIICSRCNKEEAEVTCQMCTSPFCVFCYEAKHNVKPWTNHTFVPIIKKVFVVEDKKDKKKVDKNNKKKKGDKGKGGKGKDGKDSKNGKNKKDGGDDVSVSSKSSKGSKSSKASAGSKGSKGSKGSSKGGKGGKGGSKKEGGAKKGGGGGGGGSPKKEEGATTKKNKKKKKEGSGEDGKPKKKVTMAPVLEESAAV